MNYIEKNFEATSKRVNEILIANFIELDEKITLKYFEATLKSTSKRTNQRRVDKNEF